MGGLRILIVDDDPDVQQVLTETLQWAGHSVRVAAHGQHALELLATDFRAHVILLDLVMPVMDGIAFLGQKRGLPELVQIPVIVISSTAEPPIPGASCVLRKPVDLTELLAVLKSYSAQ